VAILEGGTTGNAVEAGAASGANALHVQARPASYGSLGHYLMAGGTGTMAAGLAGSSDIFHFRWTHATYLALIKRIEMQYFNSLGTGFTAGLAYFGVFVARSWSADGSGGTTLTPSANNQKLRASMATTSVGSARIASTAALTAGTKTHDSQVIAMHVAQVTTATNTTFQVAPNGILYRAKDFDHPITLVQNEGIVVQASPPATGTWEARIAIEWAEVTAF
jgi:hypothetical protein